MQHWLPPGDVTPFVRQHRLVRVSDRHLVVDIGYAVSTNLNTPGY